MHFLVGTIILLAIIYFMIVSPGFRAVAIVLLVGVGIFAIVINNSSVESEKRNRERTAQAELDRRQDSVARSLIAPHLIAITATSLKKETYDWKFTGTVKNSSEHTLTEIRFRVTMNDCAQSSCVTIGESDAETGSLTVPPGQARAFSAAAIFKNLPHASGPQWNYKITGTRGLTP